MTLLIRVFIFLLLIYLLNKQNFTGGSKSKKNWESQIFSFVLPFKTILSPQFQFKMHSEGSNRTLYVITLLLYEFSQKMLQNPCF